MSRMHRLVAAGALCAVLACGCATMSGGEAPALDGTAWVLSTLGGKPPLAGRSVTAQFDGGRVQGTDGCNRYSALYTRTAGEFTVGQRGPSTLMACEPQVMQQAEAFAKALAATRRYRVAGGRLELLGADQAVLASFAAQSQALAGTSWQVNMYNNGRQAVTTPIVGTDLTLAFGDDGRYSGSAGCNRYTGAFTAQGLKVSLGPPAATRRMCAAPQGIMEQEQAFLKALTTIAVARFEGERVELRSADGAMAVVLVRAGDKR